MSALPRPAVPRPAGDVPVDAAYLRAQVPALAETVDPITHYLERGLADRLNPTPWFLTDWYAWQNPDWCQAHPAPYLHYLGKGRHEGRDPSPFVDIHRYRQAVGPSVPPERIYDLILAGWRSPALGVCDGPEALHACQRRFLEAISVVAHRARPPARPRPALVFLQAGRGSMAASWYDDGLREWDVLVNYYDAEGYRPGFGDYVFFQKGTKFTAMWSLWQRFAWIFGPYEHVLLLDDDVAATPEALNRLFRTCRAEGLDLAQMSLTSDSSCNWSELFQRPGATGPRAVSAVEIMMPVLSRRALGLVAPTFGRSVSGFGLDLAWGRIVADAGGRIAVLDEVAATHARPVDQGGGAYYSYLRRHMINAKAELWALVTEYGADRDLVSG